MIGWRKKLDQHSPAFTIVELLVVIVVIGILAAIIIVGYGAVQGNAHDASVKSDLQKVDDAFKLFALDNGGVYPQTEGDLVTLGLKLNTTSYYTSDKANFYVCKNAAASEYAVIAKSLSGTRFVVKSEQGISQYSGSVVWDASTENWETTCSSINPSYVPLTGNVTGMETGVWAVWTGIPIITNLATNPAFGASVSGWSSSGAGTDGFLSSVRTATIGPTSNYAMRETWTTAATAGGHSSEVTSSLAVASGTTYTASCYARPSDIISSGRVSVTTGSSTFDSSNVVLEADVYTRLSLTFTTTGSASDIKIGCRINDLTGTTDGFIFDTSQFMLTEGSTLYPYADGTSLGWQWNGTAHLSTSSGSVLNN